MTVQIDPVAQVNTIPLSRYCTLFPTKHNKSRYPKALLPISHTWMSHYGSPKPFLGHFVAEVKHASEPRTYPTHFYISEDAMSPQILLSYVTLERLGIIVFKVPNLAATSQVDNLKVPTSPNPSGMRKTAKTVTFWDPLVEVAPSHSSVPSLTSCHDMRKTTYTKVSISSSGTECNTPTKPIKSILVHHLPPKATVPTKSTLKVHSPPGDFPVFYCPGLGRNGIEVSHPQLLWHHW